MLIKVENILKGSPDSIPLPSPSVKIQIVGGKVCFRCNGKTLLGDVNKLFFKSLLITPSNVLPLHLKQTFPAIIWIFTVCKGDEMESRLPFKIFSTLPKNWKVNCIQFTYLLVTFLLISFLAAMWNQYAISITHVKNKIWLVPHSHVCYITFFSNIQIPFNYLEFD